MSIWLMLYYKVGKKIEDAPAKFNYHKNEPDDHQYYYEPGQGPLVDLLMEKESLPKVLDAEVLSKVKYMIRDEGKHDTKAMLAFATEFKKQLEVRGDQVLTDMGYDLEWRNTRSKDILLEDLGNLIEFCEFGIKNKIKEFRHVFQ